MNNFLNSLKNISPSRWLRMIIGLWIFGTGDALMISAGVGLAPWTVFAEGLSKLSGLQVGIVTILVGAAVLGLWVFINEKPGIATVFNIILIGTAIYVMTPFLPVFQQLPLQLSEMALGVITVGIGGAIYMSANLGRGPRDGLMVGLSKKYGWSIRVTRTIIEVTVLALGLLLGGTVGIGTVVFALGIGPVLQFMLKLIGYQPNQTPVPTVSPQVAK